MELLQRDEPARLRGDAGQLLPHPPVQQLLQPAPARPLGKGRGGHGGHGTGVTAPTPPPPGPLGDVLVSRLN